jgi:RimJ/RimL family protein N-acetyltransferase
MPEYIIKFDNLLVSEFLEQDIDDEYIRWLNDKDVTKYSRQRHITHTLKTSLNYLNTFKYSNNLFLLLQVQEIGKIVTATVYIDEELNRADIGILLGRKDLWGKGYGANFFRLIVSHCFNFLGVTTVSCGTLVDNLGMNNLAKSLGMKLFEVQNSIDDLNDNFVLINKYKLNKVDFHEQ